MRPIMVVARGLLTPKCVTQVNAAVPVMDELVTLVYA